MQYVYILMCKNGTLYTGCTNNLKDRMGRHLARQVASTKNRFPIKLIYYSAFTDKYKAFAFEKYLKSGSGRAFVKKHF